MWFGFQQNANVPRYPVSRSGNNPGKVKRVVSCKRKTHHLTVARRKQLGTGRTYDAANKENQMNCKQDIQQEIFDVDPWELPLNVNNYHKTGRTGSEQADYCLFTEVRHTITFLVLLYFYFLWITVLLICRENCLNLTMFCSSQGIIAQWLMCCLEEIWDWKCL